jgi:hypothetical protein
VIYPRVQYPVEELKSEMSRTPVPIPRLLALDPSAQVASWPGERLLTKDRGGQFGPWQLQRAMRDARTKVPGLP